MLHIPSSRANGPQPAAEHNSFRVSPTPGRFRKIQNWIGKPGSTPATASFVPPPPDEVEPCLADWEKFVHDSDLPPLITVALAHYQFEAIHPFLDGNGRVGRLLITLFLI